jgi:hypothetical protein
MLPLSIIIKSDTAPSYFVITGYTDNFLEYSFIKILHTSDSALTSKNFVGKQPPTASLGGSWIVSWVSGVNGDV